MMSALMYADSSVFEEMALCRFLHENHSYIQLISMPMCIIIFIAPVI